MTLVLRLDLSESSGLEAYKSGIGHHYPMNLSLKSVFRLISEVWWQKCSDLGGWGSGVDFTLFLLHGCFHQSRCWRRECLSAAFEYQQRTPGLGRHRQTIQRSSSCTTKISTQWRAQSPLWKHTHSKPLFWKRHPLAQMSFGWAEHLRDKTGKQGAFSAREFCWGTAGTPVPRLHRNKCVHSQSPFRKQWRPPLL